MYTRMMVVGVVAVMLAGSWAMAQPLTGNPKKGEESTNSTVFGAMARLETDWGATSKI